MLTNPALPTASVTTVACLSWHHHGSISQAGGLETVSFQELIKQSGMRSHGTSV